MLCPAEFLNGKVRASCCFESMAHERCRTLWAIGGHVFLRESELCGRRNIRKHRRSGEGTIEVKNKVTSCGPLTRGVPLSCGLSFNKLIDSLPDTFSRFKLKYRKPQEARSLHSTYNQAISVPTGIN